MTEDELIAAADANYFESWALLARQAPDGHVSDAPGLMLTSTGFEAAWINLAFVTAPPPDAPATVAHVAAFYAELGMPWNLRIRAGLDGRFEREAESAGLRHTGDTPGMVMHPLEARPEAPSDLRIERVRGERDLAIYGRVCITAFGLPAPMTAIFTGKLLADAEAYVGFVGDEPVATALLARTGDVAGIYNIGTLAPWRGRGIGEAVTWHAVEQGRRQGCTMASLQASDMGRPVYERMGFRTVAQYRNYTPGGEGEDAEG